MDKVKDPREVSTLLNWIDIGHRNLWCLAVRLEIMYNDILCSFSILKADVQSRLYRAFRSAQDF